MSTSRMTRMLTQVLGIGLFIALMAGAFLFIHAPPVALAQGDFAGGLGTENDPYLIATY